MTEGACESTCEKWILGAEVDVKGFVGMGPSKNPDTCFKDERKKRKSHGQDHATRIPKCRRTTFFPCRNNSG